MYVFVPFCALAGECLRSDGEYTKIKTYSVRNDIIIRCQPSTRHKVSSAEQRFVDYGFCKHTNERPMVQCVCVCVCVNSLCNSACTCLYVFVSERHVASALETSSPGPLFAPPRTQTPKHIACIRKLQNINVQSSNPIAQYYTKLCHRYYMRTQCIR